jgi:hypothetical protein
LSPTLTYSQKIWAPSLMRLSLVFSGPGELDNSAIVEALKGRNAHYEQLVADALKHLPAK